MHLFLSRILQFALIVSSGIAVCLAQEDKSLPNIIIVLADDLGYGDLSISGNQLIATPHLDRMAGEGVRLTSFYASANVCTPSRAGLLTGRYPIRTGLAYKVIEADHTHGLPQEEITLAELLKDNGYRTAAIGKWHLGHMPDYWPTAHGFDYFYGLPYSNDMQPLALYRDRLKIEEPVDQRTLTERYTAEAIQFIEQNKDGPFLVYLPHTMPHIPLYVSGTFEGRSRAGLYGDVVETLDWSMGELFAALKRLGLDDNTLVIFTSDNGPFFEGSSGDWRQGKGTTWEGGYRVPLIARWPGRIPPGTVSDAISMNIDILPTLAALVGAPLPIDHGFDGRNIWDLFQGSSDTPHEFLYFFNNEDIAAVRTQQWKLVLRAYYRTSLVAFDTIEEALGFSYPLLFDMTTPHPERYSQARDNPDALATLEAYLARGRTEFEPLRTRPAPKTVP
jgi:uncharacterized sulfatase